MYNTTRKTPFVEVFMKPPWKIYHFSISYRGWYGGGKPKVFTEDFLLMHFKIPKMHQCATKKIASSIMRTENQEKFLSIIYKS